MTNSGFLGLVLAGGLSIRMGSDKSQLVYQSLPQYEQVARLLELFCRQVFISVRNPLPALSFPVIADRFPSEGPLAGILSALTEHPGAAWLIAPVDMPALDYPTVDFLVRHHSPAHSVTCFRHPDDHRPEPLLAIWQGHVLPDLLTYYNRGGRSVRRFIESTSAVVLNPPDARTLVNVNTPAEQEAFLAKKLNKAK